MRACVAIFGVAFLEMHRMATVTIHFWNKENAKEETTSLAVPNSFVPSQVRRNAPSGRRVHFAGNRDLLCVWVP